MTQVKKLEIKHLAPYLPYGLEFMYENDINELMGIYASIVYSTEADESGEGTFDISDIKPILRPLSDYLDINFPAIIDMNTDILIACEISDFANKQIGLYQLSYQAVVELIAHHADVFGLIEQGLAIDINTTINK